MISPVKVLDPEGARLNAQTKCDVAASRRQRAALNAAPHYEQMAAAGAQVKSPPPWSRVQRCTARIGTGRAAEGSAKQPALGLNRGRARVG